MVKAVAKAFDILDFVLESALLAREATLGAIAEAIGIQNTTARNILKTMEDCGYIARGDHRSYLPGPRCRDMESVAVFSSLSARAGEATAELARLTGQSAVLAALLHGRRRVVMRCEGAGMVRIDPDLAEDAPFYSLVTSRVLAAWCTDAQRSDLVAQYGLPKDDWDGLGSVEALNAAVEALRRRGFASDQPDPTRLAIAVPVLDRSGGLLAALGVHMTASAYGAMDDDELINDMKRIAASICGD